MTATAEDAGGRPRAARSRTPARFAADSPAGGRWIRTLGPPATVSSVLAPGQLSLASGTLAPRAPSAFRREGQIVGSRLCCPLESLVGTANGSRPPPAMPRCPTSKSPGASNPHSPSDGGSGLVQPVFRSPARIPPAESTRKGLCAAPPSEKRYTLSLVRWAGAAGAANAPHRETISFYTPPWGFSP